MKSSPTQFPSSGAGFRSRFLLRFNVTADGVSVAQKG
jgi:hypothetical protein